MNHPAADYIIVGGGTAGLVVASRLSEDPTVQVLVIEAGLYHKDDPNVNIPGFMFQMLGKPEYDWNFMIIPQVALGGRQVAHPRGRMLGGSSGINLSAVIYPGSADLEAWSQLGNTGWSSSDMEPYFRKFQTLHPPTANVVPKMQLHACVDEALKRDEGPLPIVYLQDYSDTSQAWVRAFGEFGFDVAGDPIHGKKLGVFTSPATIHPETQTRAYSASAYYNEKVAARTNLRVLTESVVRRIVLEDTDGGVCVARGVEIVAKNGDTHTLHIKDGGEVILSAGALKSPQVLELSGIGNEELLRRHNIPVKVSNLNVGENLQDHPIVPVGYEVADGIQSGDMMRDPTNVMKAIEQYQTSKSGPLAGAQLGFSYLPFVDANGLIEDTRIQELIREHLQNEQGPTKPQSDILCKLLADPQESTGEFMMMPAQLNINPEGPTYITELLAPKQPENFINFVAIVNRPFSRGSVHIRSADPHENPDLDPRYLSHPLDVEILARLTQFLPNIAKTDAMSKILKENGRCIPEEAARLDSLEVAKEMARKRCSTCYHPCSSCAMLPKEQGGVVSDRMVVYGTTNIRVVDASIFPMMPMGNIQAMVYATAERAADIIREDRKSQA